MNTLTYDERLTKAALDHINDIGPKSILSHDSSDGKTVSDRIERYCEWEGICEENIDFGSKTAVDVIVFLLVDDGMEGRPHRKNMLSNEIKYVGIASGEHKGTGVMTVIDYVGGIRDVGKPFYNYNDFKYQYPEDLNVKVAKSKDKNSFQFDDEDAPNGTISVKIEKKEKEYQGKKHRITKKIYTLNDGSQQIVELEDF